LGVEIKVHIYTYIFHFAEVLATLAFDVEAFEPDAANFDTPTEAFAVTLPATLVIEGFGADPATFEIEVSAGPVSASGAAFAAALTPAFEVVLAATFDEVVRLLRLPVVGDPPSAPSA
jgi:hypothetical protein